MSGPLQFPTDYKPRRKPLPVPPTMGGSFVLFSRGLGAEAYEVLHVYATPQGRGSTGAGALFRIEVPNEYVEEACEAALSLLRACGVDTTVRAALKVTK